MKPGREPQCCRFCGRDTMARDGVCGVCINGRSVSRHTEERDRQRKKVSQQWESDADHFDDESGPDDVFQERNTTLREWDRKT